MCLRGLVASCVIFLKINTDTKKVMWDSVPNDMWGNITLRVVQGILVKLCQFTVIKYFTLTTMTLIYNLDPFFTLIFGRIFLSE